MSSEILGKVKSRDLSQQFRFLTEADSTGFESPKLGLKKSQLHLKEILFDHHDELQNIQNTESLTAQQRTQYKRIKQNEEVFNQLLDTMNRRKITFMNFSFKCSELDEDTYMKPIIKGIYDHQKKGSMLVTELWTKEQIRDYLKKSSLQQPKRILKRFAHWQWDQNTKPEKLKDISEQLKVDLFSVKKEMVYKKKLEGTNGEKRLKRYLQNQWMSEHKEIDSDIRKFGKYTNDQRICEIVKPRAMPSLKLQNLSKIFDRAKTEMLPEQLQHSNNALNGILKSIDAIKLDNIKVGKECRSLKITLRKLEVNISKKESQKQFHKQNPFRDLDLI